MPRRDRGGLTRPARRFERGQAGGEHGPPRAGLPSLTPEGRAGEPCGRGEPARPRLVARRPYQTVRARGGEGRRRNRRASLSPTGRTVPRAWPAARSGTARQQGVYGVRAVTGDRMRTDGSTIGLTDQWGHRIFTPGWLASKSRRPSDARCSSSSSSRGGRRASSRGAHAAAGAGTPEMSATISSARPRASRAHRSRPLRSTRNANSAPSAGPMS